MKKNLYFILILFAVNGCIIFQKPIKKLEKDNVPFSSIPVEVKDFFYILESINTRTERVEFFNNSENVPSTEKHDYFSPQLFTFNTSYEYQFKTIDLVKDLWISHYLLIDKTNNITYRMDYGTPLPVIVCGKELFVPTEFNVLSVKEANFETLTFNKYSLETKKLRRRIRKDTL